MGEILEQVGRADLLADAHQLVSTLQQLKSTYDTDDDVVAALRSLETLRRRLEPVEHALLLEAEARGIPAAAGFRSTGGWLRQTLQLDISEGNARVRAAHAAGPRRSLLGEPLPPTYPVVAAAQAAGEVSAAQARVITTMLTKLPADVQCHAPEVETRLVGFCDRFDPAALKQLADRERDFLDPDGGWRDVQRRRRDRDLHLHVRPDGSCRGSFEGTAEMGEFLQTALDALAAPNPESNGVKDPRSAGQRRHDGLLDALKIAVGSGSLPSTGGVLATVVLTMTTEAYATGEGFARTSHGAQVPVKEALSWAGGDYRLMVTAMNSLKTVVAYSTVHRLFTEGARLAMIARDGGCAFPGCQAPPGWTQAHHITEWRDTHRTTVDDGCLLCGWHHREFERLGWSVAIDNGRPQWTPPRTIDPEQKPIRT